MMKTNVTIKYNTNPKDAKNYDTTALREEYLIRDMFQDDTINHVYSYYDRMIITSINPVKETLKLEAIEHQKADFFLMRREMGVINVGGKGTVTAEGENFELDYKDALYIGLGVNDITFKSADKSNPAKFYINSCLAHKNYPNKKISKKEAIPNLIGDQQHASYRSLNQYIVPNLVKTCQLMMGVTEVQDGNVWNTMPCHLHQLRMEAYFYFEIPEDQAVLHLMGQPDETRHLWIHNDECALSPSWSIHSASGTTNYCFIWGMAGSDSDMDGVKTNELK
jgi:4-deoxy-L-threo-5-hexosulose-uronate ketol-isomerase